MSIILPFLLTIALTFVGHAGDLADYSTPSAGSQLRKELLDTIRVPTEAHLGQSVVFKVNTLRVKDTWAFFVGEAIRPNGKPIDYRKSKSFKEDPKTTQMALDAGSLYGGVDALMKKEGANWKILAIVFDAGDVHWLDYDKRFGVPRKLIVDPIK